MAKRETKKIKQRKHILRVVSQTTLFIAFFGLLLEGIVMVAYGLSVENIENNNGVPANWAARTGELPDTISVPVTYYDQLSEPCSLATVNKQFEFSRCGSPKSGLQQGLVKDTLGADKLPVPANATRNTKLLETSQGVLGNDPVQATDNFYRWFHEVDGKSQKVAGRSVTFKKVGDELYQYGGSGIFPVDDVVFSKGDYNANRNHNFHFTMTLSVPFYVKTASDDYFEFEGDDDVWVFVNNKLILDIGGVHGAIKGHFKINPNGTITSTVDGKSRTVDAGLTDGMLTSVDFFYAERNTTEANCKITIRGMLLPVSATPTLKANLTDDNLVEYNASLKNTSPLGELTVENIASFLEDDDEKGFLGLSNENISYTLTPGDDSSWKTLDINAPTEAEDGFKLVDNITLKPYGQAGDTLYLHYYVKPDEGKGELKNTLSFMASNENSKSIITASEAIAYDIVLEDDKEDGDDKEDEGDKDDEKDDEGGEEEDKDDDTGPIAPVDDPWSDDIDDDISSGNKDPLGEIKVVGDYYGSTPGGMFTPNTGSAGFAAIIMSQAYMMTTLGLFAVSFAVFWSVRKY